MQRHPAFLRPRKTRNTQKHHTEKGLEAEGWRLLPLSVLSVVVPKARWLHRWSPLRHAQNRRVPGAGTPFVAGCAPLKERIARRQAPTGECAGKIFAGDRGTWRDMAGYGVGVLVLLPRVIVHPQQIV